jgi:undecaprenyl-diphosphatase
MMRVDMPDHMPGMPDRDIIDPAPTLGFIRQAKLRIQSHDTVVMRYIFDLTKGSRGELGAILVSKLGNGWLYLFLFPFLLFELQERRFAATLTAAANIGVSHSIYPWIKRRYRRIRPFHVDPTLISLLPTRDEFSFPSGHTMTLAAALMPVAYLYPEFWVPSIFMILLMAWARIASGHHYPTDVCAGASMGGIIGMIISVIFLRG